MTKRATNSTVLKTIGGRRSLLSSALCLRALFTGTVVALALGGVATSAHAVSGENADTEGTFQASCEDLRNETDFPGGDEIFVCDSGSEQCRLFSATDEGVGLGFCDDSIESVAIDRGGDVEPTVPIDATTFGSVIGVSNPTGDIFCETFGTTSSSGSPGKKVCIRISPGNCTPGTAGGSFEVQCGSCPTVEALLEGSVTANASNFKWFLFTDSEKTGQPNGSGVLSVCAGNKWTSLPLSAATIAKGLTVKYQANMFLIQTPHYTTIAGRRICKNVTGESPTHTCP